MKKSFLFFILLTSFIIISCSEKTEPKKTVILEPICKKQKEYEMVKDPSFDYPITYKVKKKKCIIEYRKKTIYINE